jgi:acylpyruvate hydrolase
MIFRVSLKRLGVPTDPRPQIPELIKHCSSIMTLEEGDLLLTGTPSGVGPIRAGDKIEAALSSEGDVKLAWSGSVRDRPGGYRFQA